MSVPEPSRTGFSSADEVAWYARLPTMFGAAGALFTNPGGRILLVKPNYRDHWSLPGGILEHGEPPHVGCRREVKEELGLDIDPGPLLVIGWAPPYGDRPRPVVHFVFDGGELHDGAPIELQGRRARRVPVRRARRPGQLPAAGHPRAGGRRGAQPRHRDDRLPAVERAGPGAC